MKPCHKPVKFPRLSLWLVYKLMGIGFLFSMVPTATVLGICALLGANSITWNGRHLYGVKALLASPFIGVQVAVIATMVFGTFCGIGLWLYSLLRPMRVVVRDDLPDWVPSDLAQKF